MKMQIGCGKERGLQRGSPTGNSSRPCPAGAPLPGRCCRRTGPPPLAFSCADALQGCPGGQQTQTGTKTNPRHPIRSGLHGAPNCCRSTANRRRLAINCRQSSAERRRLTESCHRPAEAALVGGKRNFSFPKDNPESLAHVGAWGGRVFVSRGGGGSIEPSGRTPPPPKKRAQLTGPPKSYRD